jgi:hypothetical protein
MRTNDGVVGFLRNVGSLLQTSQRSRQDANDNLRLLPTLRATNPVQLLSVSLVLRVLVHSNFKRKQLA